MRRSGLFGFWRPAGRHAATRAGRRRGLAPIDPPPSQAESTSPPPDVRQPAERAGLAVAAPVCRVRLGFADGTEIELDQKSGASEALRDAARRIIVE
jgi:hypothetical protein